MKKFILPLLGLLLLPLPAEAMRFETGEDIILNEDIQDDLYIAGGMVEINSNIQGDLVIAGGIVRVNGNISEDTIVAGGNVTISGNIGDDLKIIGGQTLLNGKVADDVVGTGGIIEFASSSEVSGSVSLASGFTRMNGTIKEDLTIKGGTIIFGGTVGRAAILHAENIEFTENAEVGAYLNYSLPEPNQNFEKYVLSGQIEYTKPETINLEKTFEEFSLQGQIDEFFNKIRFGFIMASFINLFILGLIVWLIGSRFLHYTAETLVKKPGVSFGIGAAFVIITPVISIFLFLSLFGILASFSLMAIWALLICFAKIIVSIAIGNLIIPVKKPENKKWHIFGGFVLGLIIYELLVNIPLFGGFMVILASIFGAGAILVAIRNLCLKMHEKKII